MSQIGNIQNGSHIQPGQDVQSTQNTEAQQTAKLSGRAPRGISSLRDGSYEVMPSNLEQFKTLEKYLAPPERTGFEKFCKGVERITKSWFKTEASQTRAKEDFDHIVAKLAMNIHKCWVEGSIDEADKKAFATLLKDLKVEARILGMNANSFSDRIQDCLTVVAKGFADADFYLTAGVYMNANSSLKEQFAEVFKSIDPTNTLKSMSVSLTRHIREALPGGSANKPIPASDTSPQPAEKQEVNKTIRDLAQTKKQIQQKLDSTLGALDKAKVELGDLKQKLQDITGLSVTQRFTLRNELMAKLQTLLGGSVVEAYQALHKKGVADAVRDVKILSTEDLIKQMGDMLNGTAPASKQTSVDNVQDKKLNFYEQSALELKKNVQNYCQLFSEIFELLDMRELEARAHLESAYQDLLLPAKDFKFKPLVDLLSMQISPDEAEAAKSKYQQCHAQLMAMFSDIGKPNFNPSPEQLRALSELEQLKQFFPEEQQKALSELQATLNRYVSLRPLALIHRLMEADPRSLSMDAARQSEWKEHCAVIQNYLRDGAVSPISAKATDSFNYLIEHTADFELMAEDVVLINNMANFVMDNESVRQPATSLRGLGDKLTIDQAQKMQTAVETHQLLMDITAHLCKGLPENDPLTQTMRGISSLSTRMQNFAFKVHSTQDYPMDMLAEDVGEDVIFNMLGDSQWDNIHDGTLDTEYNALKQEFFRSMQELTSLIFERAPSTLSTMEGVQASDRIELMRSIPELLKRINASLPCHGVGMNVLQFSDWLVESAATAASYFPQMDKNEADKIRKLFLARTDLSVDDLDSNKNIRLQEKLRDILAPLQQDWRNYQNANETERHKLAKQLKTSFNPDNLADELRSVMHGLDSLAVGGVKEFKRLGLSTVKFLFDNEDILLARSPQSLRQSNVDNSVRVELVKDGKWTWVDLKDEVDNYLSNLSMTTEKNRQILAEKITKFSSIIEEKGYRWDSNAPLGVDKDKKLTGIVVTDSNRTAHTLDLAGMKKLMLEALEAKVQLERRPFFSTNHHSSSGI